MHVMIVSPKVRTKRNVGIYVSLFHYTPKGITKRKIESGTCFVPWTHSIDKGIVAALLDEAKAIICAGPKWDMYANGFRRVNK